MLTSKLNQKIERCQIDGKPGYRGGSDPGFTFYGYRQGNTESRRRAKKLAERELKAVQNRYVKKFKAGWWFRFDGDAYGPYTSIAAALSDRRGLKRFELYKDQKDYITTDYENTDSA